MYVVDMIEICKRLLVVMGFRRRGIIELDVCQRTCRLTITRHQIYQILCLGSRRCRWALYPIPFFVKQIRLLHFSLTAYSKEFSPPLTLPKPTMLDCPSNMKSWTGRVISAGFGSCLAIALEVS